MNVLPKIALPASSYTLPDSGVDIKIRPMTGMEFEILLVAKESDSHKTQVNAVFDMLDAVVTEPENFKSKDLSPMDFDFLFTRLIITSYAKQSIDIAYKCQTITEPAEGNKREKRCGELINVNIHLDDDVSFDMTEVNFKTEYNLLQYKLIVSSPDTSSVMASSQDDVFDLVAGCIDKLVDTATGKEWTFKGDNPDVSAKERDEFIRSTVPSTIIRDIATNVSEYPRMEYSGKVKCRSCKAEHSVELKGFLDFFGFASPNTK